DDDAVGEDEHRRVAEPAAVDVHPLLEPVQREVARDAPARRAARPPRRGRERHRPQTAGGGGDHAAFALEAAPAEAGRVASAKLGNAAASSGVSSHFCVPRRRSQTGSMKLMFARTSTWWM